MSIRINDIYFENIISNQQTNSVLPVSKSKKTSLKNKTLMKDDQSKKRFKQNTLKNSFDDYLQEEIEKQKMNQESTFKEIVTDEVQKQQDLEEIIRRMR